MKLLILCWYNSYYTCSTSIKQPTIKRPPSVSFLEACSNQSHELIAIAKIVNETSVEQTRPLIDHVHILDIHWRVLTLISCLLHGLI